MGLRNKVQGVIMPFDICGIQVVLRNGSKESTQFCKFVSIEDLISSPKLVIF